MRGEWRIAEARLEGPELAAGLDGSGRIAWPLPKLGFDLEGVSIERLQIEDGRAVLADAASDTRLVLEQAGIQGRAALTGRAGQRRRLLRRRRPALSVSRLHRSHRRGRRRARCGSRSSRSQLPLTTDADLTIWTEQGTPRFEGSVQLVRPVGRAPVGAQALIIDSWRVTSRIKGDSTAAAAGSDRIPVRARRQGDQASGQRQSDVRRAAGNQRRPVVAADRPRPRAGASRAHRAADRCPPPRRWPKPWSPMSRLPIPTTLEHCGRERDARRHDAGARERRGEVRRAMAWRSRRLDLRAPGATQLRLSGRVGTTSAGMRFQGSTQVEANDPRALVAWLTERSDEQIAAAGPWRLGGDITLGSDAIAIERLKLELDRMTVAGRFAYAWADEDRPARLDAALTAPDIDLDRVNLRCQGDARRRGVRLAAAKARCRSRSAARSSPASRRSRPT